MEERNISKDITWVGKVDDRKVPFHRLILEKGTTYNSYLIHSEKPTIIDTVDIEFGREYMENLSKLIDPSEIEFVVINHVEPDHAGSLPALLSKALKAKIVCTELAALELKRMFRLQKREFLIVKDGDALEIGGKTLLFLETPYLHTEETMMTYLVEDQILFSCDVFSTHIAAVELFNDLSKQEYEEDFKVYYDLIMKPHRPYVSQMLTKIKEIPIQMIAPSHGYILRKDPDKYIEIYREKSQMKDLKNPKKVVIAYSTMTGNTGKIAATLSESLTQAGVDVTVFHLKNANLEEVKDRIRECDGLLVGSATRYGDMVGNMEEFLKILQGEDFHDKKAAAFGSYGWSGEAIAYIDDYLNQLGFCVIDQKYLIKTLGVDSPLLPLRVKFSIENQQQVEESGRVFGEQI